MRRRGGVRKAAGFVFIAVALLLLNACEGNPEVTVQPASTSSAGSGGATVVSVSVTPTGPVPLSVGQTAQLTGKALDSSNNAITGVSLIWSSSNGNVATVSSTGLAAAISPGSAAITASSGNVTSNSVDITVSCAGIPSNSPTLPSVVLNPPSPIPVNATTSVSATIRDCNGSPVPDGTTVAFSLTPAGLGTLSPSSAQTVGGGGVASVSFIAGSTAGSGTIIATAGIASNSTPVKIPALPAGSIKFEKADPTVIGVKTSGQVEVSEVSFSVKDTQGNPVADGSVTVRFEFLKSSGLGTGLNPGGSAVIDPSKTSTVKGIAKTFLKSGLVAGPVRILAFVDEDDDGVLDSGEIFTTSIPLSIGGGVPSMRFFSVSANKHNLAGLAFDNEKASITVRLADRFGNYNVLENTAVSFYTEAGAIDRQGLTNSQGEATVTFRTQNRPPVDTDPRQDLNPIGAEVLLYNNLNLDGRDGGEPFEDFDGDGSYDVGEHFFDLDGDGYDLTEPNPRDGWVSVLAVTQGEETFYDLNGNGLYDAGEAFDDNGGEPFIDENDNGMYDDQEAFTDLNANNSYDPGEPFLDKGRGEPFLDKNNNGSRDAGEPFTDLDGDLTFDAGGEPWYDANSNNVFDVGEPFTDLNGNGTFDRAGFYNHVYDRGEFYLEVDGDGKWTHGNGQWDSNTTLWVDLRRPGQTQKVSQILVFTGPPDVSLETSRIVIDAGDRDPGSPRNFFVSNGGDCADFTVFVADFNNNALIPGTAIETAVEGAGALFGASSFTVGDNIGGGPIVLGFSICDPDPTKDEGKSSALEVTITWKPDGAATSLITTMTVGGLVR